MDDDIRNRFRGASRKSSMAYGPTRRSLPPTNSMRRSGERAVRPQSQGNLQPTVASSPSSSVAASRRRKSKGTSKKFLLFILIIGVLIGSGVSAYGLYKKYIHKPVSSQTTAQATPKTDPPKATGTIRFIAVGDSLAYESVNGAAKQADGSYDYLPLMTNFKPLFDKADVRLCTEATPGGGDKNGLALSAYPTFNAPLSWSTGFANLGCNLINLATNHINDKSQTAIDATLDTWDEQKNILAVAGANRSAEEQAKVRYFTVKNVKFAYVAYTTSSANKPTNTFGVNIYSDELANQQLAEARTNADLVIVSMNWGTENSADITPDQDRIAQNLANQNVDVIVGSGPHVVQPAKVLEGKNGHQTLAWFSLGNFLNSELSIDNLIGGMAIMDFDVATQQIEDPKLLPVYMHYEWTPAQKAAGTLSARHSFMLYPLDLAAAPLAKSQNNTTVEAQTARVTSIIAKFVPIKVIKSTDY